MPAQLNWIFKDYKKDLIFIHFPGIFSILLIYFLKDYLLLFLPLMFIIVYLIDGGHVYSTFVRTIFLATNIKDKAFHIAIVITIFFYVFLYSYFRLPYFWNFLAYFTIFHHLRQSYGIGRWYQRLNGRFCRSSNTFYYLLTLMPFILIHFRNLPELEFFTKNDFYRYPSIKFFKIGVSLYFLILLSWPLNEYRLFKKNKIFETNRFLGILTPSLIFAYCMIFGTKEYEIFYPLMVLHGINYISLIGVSTQKIKKGDRLLDYLIPIFIFTSVLGTYDYFLESWLDEELPNYIMGKTFQNSLFISLVSAPILYHYILDSFIWKNKNKAARSIYNSFERQLK